jgi:undecaprenyl-diphosphatase
MSPRLPLRHAVALGLVHGPTELLPVSSSGHTVLIPWLAGWPYAELEPELRKSFEVALHAGASVALLIGTRRELAQTARGLDRRGAQLISLSLLVPAVVGYTLEGPVERRLSGPGAIAVGLLTGALCMAVADARGQTGREPGQAGALEGLLLGVAQAAALLPGVSRNGATLTAMRARGFSREDSHTLSWLVAPPVILAAGALKGYRLHRQARSPHSARSLAAGAGAAFLSTLVSIGPIRRRQHGGSLLPYSLYRCALALVVIRRMRDSRRSERLSAQ